MRNLTKIPLVIPGSGPHEKIVVGEATVDRYGGMSIEVVQGPYTEPLFNLAVEGFLTSINLGWTFRPAEKEEMVLNPQYTQKPNMARSYWRDKGTGEVSVEGFQEKARRLVFEYIKRILEKTDKHVTFSPEEVYIVWFAKTLQNWKCLISTTLPDGMYYEVTYNGDQHETYIDAYKKFDNVCIVDIPSEG
jgi:hypothetical protein